MGDTNFYEPDQKTNNFKDESAEINTDGRIYRTHCGLCCVCHTLPSQCRTYYGHVFCTDCFHKYIWTPSKRECSGDVVKKHDGETSIQNIAK